MMVCVCSCTVAGGTGVGVTTHTPAGVTKNRQQVHTANSLLCPETVDKVDEVFVGD